MCNSELETKIVDIIAKQFDRLPDKICLTDDIAKVYGAKSHDMIQLSAALQAAFGIKISYIQSRNAKTVGDWMNLVSSLFNK